MDATGDDARGWGALKRKFSFETGVRIAPAASDETATTEDELSDDEDDTKTNVGVEVLKGQYRRWIKFRRISDCILILTELVGLICVAWPAGLQLQQGDGVSGVIDLRTLQSVRDDLLYDDEVLTSSARICALSGRSDFLDLYLSTVDSLDANLAAILELQPDQAEQFLSTTAAANTELINLETEALRGCTEGADNLPPELAAPYVMGIEYETHKGGFIYGLQVLRTSIDNYLLLEGEAAWQSTVYLWTVGIIVMMLMGVSQAAQQVQEEESERLAVEFDEYVDALNQEPETLKTEFHNAAAPQPIPLPPKGNAFASLARAAMQKVDEESVMEPSSPDARQRLKAVASSKKLLIKIEKRNRKGFLGRLAVALSPWDFLRKPPLLKMERRSRILRTYMPWVVMCTHFIALGCILSPPFLQMRTEELMRMGRLMSEVTELVAKIRYYDAVLTGSARLCALTGDSRWMARYLNNVGHIDSAINNVVQRQDDIQEKYPELKEKFGGNLGEFFLETTDAANRKLIELESVVIQNCTAALLYHQDILFSDDYLQNKDILIEGLDKLSNDVVATINLQESANIETVNALYYNVVICLIATRGLVGLMFSYYYVKLNYLDDKVKVASVQAAIEDSLNAAGDEPQSEPQKSGHTNTINAWN